MNINFGSTESEGELLCSRELQDKCFIPSRMKVLQEQERIIGCWVFFGPESPQNDSAHDFMIPCWHAFYHSKRLTLCSIFV